MSRFHEEDYDGIVIKLPILFRDKELGEESISKIKNIIKEEIQPNLCISNMHPDFDKTFNELNNWDTKKEQILEKEKEKKRKQKRKHERRRRIEDHKDFELEWVTQYEYLDLYDGIKLGDDYYEYDDILNNKSIKKSFKDKLKQTSKEERFEFFNNIKRSVKFYSLTEHGVNKKLFDIPDDFIYYPKATYGDIGIKFDRLFVQAFSHKTDNNIYFNRFPLYYDSEKDLYFMSITNKQTSAYESLADDIIERSTPIDGNESLGKRTSTYLIYYFDNHDVNIFHKKIKHK